jgi:hypothetical protein
MLSQTAFKALQEAAENPVVTLFNHPRCEADAITELEPIGLVEPINAEHRWFEVTPAGFEYARSIGMDCGWWFVIQSIKVAA